MDYFIETGVVDQSSVTMASNYEICHAFAPKERLSNSTSLQELFDLLVPSMPLLVTFLVASFFYLLSAFLFAQTIKRCFDHPSRSSRSTTKKRNFMQKCFSFVAKWFQSNLMLLGHSGVRRILFITYVLFMSLVQIVISMNIKTEKIIVDTSDLIHSEETLRNTKRTPCFPGMAFCSRCSNQLVSETILMCE